MKYLCEGIAEMNFRYLYLDDKNISTKELLDNILKVQGDSSSSSQEYYSV